MNLAPPRRRLSHSVCPTATALEELVQLCGGPDWPGCSSASQPRATRRFAFDRNASTLAGTVS